MNLLEALAQHLQTRGIGSYRDSDLPIQEREWGIFLESIPFEPDKAIVITQYAGPISDSKLPYDTPRIQFLVRGTKNPSESRGVAQWIYDYFHGLGPIELYGIKIQLVLGVFSGPAYTGMDRNELHTHSVNFEVEIQNPNRRS